MSICLLFLCIWGHAQNAKVLRIDPKYARGGTASQIFDSVTYIPLETTENSLFGDIHNIQVSQHYFTFYDDDTKAIFIFDKRGKFRSKIVKSDLGRHFAWGQFFSGIDKFVLNIFSEKIFIMYDDGTSMEGKKELAVFNADGKLIASRKLGALFNNLQTSFSFIDSNRAIFASEKEDTGSKHYFHVIKNFDSAVEGIVASQLGDPMTRSYFNYYTLQSASAMGSMWIRRYDNTIYHLTDIDSIESYKVVLPQALSLDSSFYKDSSIISSFQNVEKYLFQHRDKVSSLNNLFYFKKLLFFGFLKYNTTAFMDNYFYSLNTGSLYKTYAITPDSLCYFLPIFSGSPVGADKGYIYSSISSLEMFRAYESTKYKHANYPTVLREYFATQSRKSNPVIVQLRPKTKL